MKRFSEFKIVLLLLLLITLFGALLRTNGFFVSPPSLFIDEADAGYQAYSLLLTGKDYFGNPPGAHLQSFADMRAPLYIYTAIPTVALFGLTPLGVRLPAEIFGILTIPLFFFLGREFLTGQSTRQKNIFGLLCALFLAVLPWHIHYSRMAFEATLLLFLLSGGLLLFLRWAQNHKIWQLILSLVAFLLTAYTYNTAKLFIPLLALSLLFIYKGQIFSLSKKQFLAAVFIVGIFGFPLLIDVVLGQGGARFSVLSVFADKNSIGPYEHLQWLSSYSAPIFPLTFVHPVTLSHLFLNQATNIFSEITTSYLTTFSPQFLMFSGDHNLRQNIPLSGEAGITLSLLFYFGFITWKSFPDKRTKLLLGSLLFLAPLPSAITREGEFHATRLFLLILPLVPLAAFGLLKVVTGLKSSRSRYLFLALLIGMLGWEIARDQFIRLTVYPNQAFDSWNYGWQDNISELMKLKDSYDLVLVDDLNGTPVQTFTAFYTNLDPTNFAQAVRQPQEKEVYGIPVKMYYPTQIGYGELQPVILNKAQPQKILMLLPAIKLDNKGYSNIKIVATTKGPLGNPLYYFATNSLVGTDSIGVIRNSNN